RARLLAVRTPRPQDRRVMQSPSRPMIQSRLARRMVLLLVALAAVPLLWAPAMAQSSDEAMMQVGLDFLYTNNDPPAAAAQFRKVLARNPTHYGATFQLAKALDRAGQAPEARPLWENVLKMAAVYNDAETTATAQARLATTCP